ncbi:hypothetical protein [Xanthomonas sp. LMC-A-07]|uniref:hypothetical protein n=1 Tax=Xanthomonas sp. LMC-A-07 TaxID=3040329 RepID=UPI002557037D|nr:hypothetical protein [Xanthomonas sp. LMC-A-07]
MVLQVPQRQKLSAIIFQEPLSTETEAKRRNLLFAACFSILLSVYNLKVTKTPWLEFEVPAGSPNILKGALAVALFYTFIIFALHALADLRRWFTAGDLMYLHGYHDISLKCHNILNGISQWLDKPLPEEADKKATVQAIYSGAGEVLDEIKNSVAAAKNGHRKLTAIQWLRLALIDLGVPIALGIFAMLKVGHAALPFLAVAWSEP